MRRSRNSEQRLRQVRWCCDDRCACDAAAIHVTLSCQEITTEQTGKLFQIQTYDDSTRPEMSVALLPNRAGT